MTFWRQLRWRIVGAQMLVVIVGVTIVLLMEHVITHLIVPAGIESGLAAVAGASEPAAAEAILLEAFRDSMFQATAVAALGAVVAGLASGLLLARQILRPLRQIAATSQRIAAGQYDERVTVPTSDELAMVANSFNQMADSLEHIEEQRIALIGNVSHELRTPLSGLEGYLEGLMDGLFPANEESFAPMYQEVRRLHRLVEDLQELSRVEAGQVSFHLESFDLLPLVKRVTAYLAPQAAAQTLEVVVDETEQIPQVHADPDRTAQVLTNIIGNAIRYTPEAGRITVRLAVTPPYLQVAVEDTGMGIPAESLPYLFERFYRVDASRTRRSGGSGIGLTISRHLVWMMGGNLTAASDGKDQGSTFTFTLPLSGYQLTSGRRGQPETAPNPQPGR